MRCLFSSIVKRKAFILCLFSAFCVLLSSDFMLENLLLTCFWLVGLPKSEGDLSRPGFVNIPCGAKGFFLEPLPVFLL